MSGSHAALGTSAQHRTETPGDLSCPSSNTWSPNLRRSRDDGRGEEPVLPPAHAGPPVDPQLARGDAGSDECGHAYDGHRQTPRIPLNTTVGPERRPRRVLGTPRRGLDPRPDEEVKDP